MQFVGQGRKKKEEIFMKERNMWKEHFSGKKGETKEHWDIRGVVQEELDGGVSFKPYHASCIQIKEIKIHLEPDSKAF